MPHQHEKRFRREAERLRSPDRLALLEVDRVVQLVTAGLSQPRVVDIGTGTGVFAEAFAARGLAVAAVDVNDSLLAVARSLVPGVDFREGAAEALPYGDRSFDLAFLGHVLHEVDDPAAALREARRVSVKRGAILEWPYLQEESGPPLEHRLEPGKILELVAGAGLGAAERLRLAHMDLYRVVVGPAIA